MRKVVIFLLGCVLFGGLIGVRWGTQFVDRSTETTGVREEIGFNVPGYAISFQQTGLRFAPKELETATSDWHFEYRLVQIASDSGIQSVLGGGKIQKINARRVEYSRPGGITEVYLAADGGVEQLFVLDERVGDGDLRLTGQVLTNLAGRADPDGGIRFSNQGWDVLRYGSAVAIDTAGSIMEAQLTYSEARLELTVSGDWLDTAAYPVVIDPFIGGDFLISVAEGEQSYQDIAYNSVHDEWLVVWQDDRAGNSDVYGQIVGSNGGLKGEVILIWADGDDQIRPSVAYDSLQNKYLVVWSGATGIEGRVLNRNGSFTTGRIAIEGNTSPVSSPDVAYNSVSDEYLVVWRRLDAGQNDIWGRRVGVDGIPDPGGSFGIRVDPGFDDDSPQLISYPEAYDGQAGQYLLVWRSDRTGTYNLLGRRLQRDGSALGGVFSISQGNGDEGQHKVALNTTTGHAMVIWSDSRDDNGDVYARLVNSDGARGNPISVFSGSGTQGEPAVAYNSTANIYFVIWGDGKDQNGQRYSPALDPIGDQVTITSADGQKIDGTLAASKDYFISVWSDNRASHTNLMAQRINQGGSLQGNEITITAALLGQINPAIAYSDYQFDFLVVWEDGRNGNKDIYGQFVEKDGSLRGDPIPICTHGAAQLRPVVAYNLNDDEFLVVWTDGRHGDAEIYGQRIDAGNGNLAGGVLRITNDPADQYDAAAAYSTQSQQYLVVWTDERDDPGNNSDFNIYGRRLMGNGAFVDGQDLVISARAESQWGADVAYNPVRDEYLVIWVDTTVGSNISGLAGQRVGAGSNWQIAHNFDISPGVQEIARASVACNTAAGAYLVVWDDLLTGGNADIYGRRIGGDGTLRGGADIVIAQAPNMQANPNVSFAPKSERYYVVWQDNRTSQTNYELYGQAVASDGELLFTDAATNVPAFLFSGHQFAPVSAAATNNDLTLVVWEDWRSIVSSDIHGRLGEPEPLAINEIFLPVLAK